MPPLGTQPQYLSGRGADSKSASRRFDPSLRRQAPARGSTLVSKTGRDGFDTHRGLHDLGSGLRLIRVEGPPEPTARGVSSCKC